MVTVDGKCLFINPPPRIIFTYAYYLQKGHFHVYYYWGGANTRGTSSITGGGLLKYTGVIKFSARKPILSVEICEIKYTVFVYIFLTKKNFHQFLHKKSKNFFFDFGGPDSVRAVMGSL